MKRQLLFISFFFVYIGCVFAKENQALNASKISRNSSVFVFLENKGQVTDQYKKARKDIQFQLKATKGLTVFVGNGSLHYQFVKATKKNGTVVRHAKKHHEMESVVYDMYRMDVALLGTNKNAKVVVDEKQDYYENYLTPATHNQEVKASSFGRITYKDIYPNIDWVLYAKEGKLKHEFIVRKGGDPKNIVLQYGGATKIILNENGSLTANTPQGYVTEQAPVCYVKENNQPVASKFIEQDNRLSYDVANYEGTLVIDPSLAWATYFGGAEDEVSNDVALNGTNNVYITGYTTSYNAIATTGAYQTTMFDSSGSMDGFVAKFNAAGNRLWGTYFGGNNNEVGSGITTDASGNVIITGYTTSDSGLIPTNAYQNTFGGYYDAYISKFNASGSRLWATYFGYSDDDEGNDVATDASGNIYITGYTASSDSGFATTGAFRTDFSGTYDVFIAKFSGAGNRVWSTYYGGYDDDEGWDIKVDGSNNIYVAGYAASDTGIASTGAYQTVFGGGFYDAFLAKFNSGGNRLWATYFGGGDDDYGYGDCVDASGNVYLTGNTYSLDSIATTGAYQINNAGSNDAYLAKFSATGTRLWSTYYGDTDDDYAENVATDAAGNAYFTGGTYSTAGIATTNAFQTDNMGGMDAYITKFSSTGSRLWASYLGAANDDYASSIVSDNAGNLFITGYSTSDTSFSTSNAYQSIYGGGFYDAFLARLNYCTATNTAGGATSFCQGTGSVTLAANTATGNTYQWKLNGTNISGATSSTYTASNSGSYTVVVVDQNSCSAVSNPIDVSAIVLPAATITASGNTTFCQGNTVTLSINFGNLYTYQWYKNNTAISGAVAFSLLVNTAGNYKIQVTDSGCSETSNLITVTVNPLPNVTITQSGNTLNCTGTFVSYQWYYNGIAISGATSANYNPTQNGYYYVVVNDANNCSNQSNMISFVVGIEDINGATPVTVFPNPTADVVNIHTPMAGDLILTDMLGKVMYNAHVEKGTTSLTVNHLAAGVYCYRFLSDNLQKANGKLVIVK